mmetsp:Transcript_45431/g.126092  ORF Transcript_45431/g.126092 Transcript_45431/m.126092 type:complete len:226 (-) Transcript_45431:2-679(-)
MAAMWAGESRKTMLVFKVPPCPSLRKMIVCTRSRANSRSPSRVRCAGPDSGVSRTLVLGGLVESVAESVRLGSQTPSVEKGPRPRYGVEFVARESLPLKSSSNSSVCAASNSDIIELASSLNLFSSWLSQGFASILVPMLSLAVTISNVAKPSIAASQHSGSAFLSAFWITFRATHPISAAMVPGWSRTFGSCRTPRNTVKPRMVACSIFFSVELFVVDEATIAV